jgi:FkbM family methyltransferase
VRTYSKIKRFELPPEEPHNFRYLLELHEPGTTTLVKKLLKRGMIAADVGAHAGYYTRLFARLVGKRGKVYAFEPTPTVFSILEVNTQRYRNVQRFNLALLDKEGLIEFHKSCNSQTNSVWPSNARGGSIGSVLVRASSLDNIVGEVSPDLVKIDVEGAELEVLRGMRRVLSRTKDIVLIVEWNPACLVGRGSDPSLLIDTIKGYGFNISGIDESTAHVYDLSCQAGLDLVLRRRDKYVNLLCTTR